MGDDLSEIDDSSFCCTPLTWPMSTNNTTMDNQLDISSYLSRNLESCATSHPSSLGATMRVSVFYNEQSSNYLWRV